MASLDAQKCFDSIWTEGLFYKLSKHLPKPVWCFYYKWYCSMTAQVRLDGSFSDVFSISRGTRQGSCASPTFFTLFLDDLLEELGRCESGLRLEGEQYNSFAYADDVSLFCRTVPGLQKLLSVCEKYANDWRFKYNPQKTKVMSVGQNILTCTPDFYMYGEKVEMVSSLEILGFKFECNGNYQMHLQTRLSKTRAAFYSKMSKGLNVVGFDPYVKAGVFRSACQSVLVYGLGALDLDAISLKQMHTQEGNLVKMCMGLSKFSKTTELLRALNVKSIEEVRKEQVLSLWHRTFQFDSLYRKLCLSFMKMYLQNQTVIRGTLLHRLLSCVLDPLQCIQSAKKKLLQKSQDGITDSIKTILYSYDLHPKSEGQQLLQMLTRAF